MKKAKKFEYISAVDVWKHLMNNKQVYAVVARPTSIELGMYDLTNGLSVEQINHFIKVQTESAAESIHPILFFVEITTERK